MKRKRKFSYGFSLSFLDSICCGFGAIILLFVISIGRQNIRVESLYAFLEDITQRRLASLNEYQVQTDQVTAMLTVELERKRRLDEAKADLDALLAKLQAQLKDESFGKENLLVDLDELKKEIAALQKEIEVEQKDILPSPVGVPVESNYIAFVIDTSGSMRDDAYNLLNIAVVKKVEEALEAYPEVEGIQVLDADGRFVLGPYMRKKWIDDSPENRAQIVRTVRLYQVESNSNPVPGIKRAITALVDPDNENMKMGIYVFGDEFTGKSEPVLAAIKNLNRDKEGERLARINAIGFPHLINTNLSFGQSGLKFANLMRELTYEHGGAFIALTQDSVRRIERDNRGRYPTPLPPPTQPGVIIPRRSPF